MTVRWPAQRETRNRLAEGSNAAASGPSQMAGLATTLPESASTTEETLSSHTAIRRRLLRSAARPEGDLHGASGHLWSSFRFCASRWLSSEVSSLLTQREPLPSATANSGLPPRGMVPMTEPSAALMAVEFLPRPLEVKGSEERRVGEEGRSRGSPYHLKKK